MIDCCRRFFFFKQKTAYEMRISDWSSDVCSSDLGFTLSPVLWRKLPSAKSAGRVQSVALRLICERETEIEAFRAREYWTIAAEFLNKDGDRKSTRLNSSH